MIPTVLMCYNKLQGRCWLWILLLVHSHTALVFVGRARTDALNGTYTNQTKPNQSDYKSVFNIRSLEAK